MPKLDVRKQKDLEKALRAIFPENHILENVRRKAGIKKSQGTKFLELDFWIPDLKLSFEFQDPYHYQTTWYAQAPLDKIKRSDEYKMSVMEERGETLLVIPCWWDGSKHSLVATIRKRRPELLSSWGPLSVAPIDDLPPPGFFKSLDHSIPDVGTLMSATLISSPNFEHENWWMSEKYDGTRVCWNPSRQILYTRIGTQVRVLDSMHSSFPSAFLDGEFWFGRGTFSESQKLFSANSQSDVPKWNNLRLIVFDCPDKAIHDSPFEARFESVIDALDPHHPFITILANVACVDRKHLQRMTIEEVMKRGGEGVVLRRPESLYLLGRSPDLLKFKASRDQEALVIEEQEGRVYTILLPNGKTTNAKLTNAQHQTGKVPHVNDVVSVAYKQLHNDLPVDPRIYQIREDVRWDDVIHNYNLSNADPASVSKREAVWTKLALGTPGKRYPPGHWTDNNASNTRAFLEDFARSRNFDPLVAENWEKISKYDIESFAGTTALTNVFKGSVSNTISAAYPELEAALASKTRGYWREAEHRRQFFDEFAKKRGFEPLVVDNWYSVTRVSLEVGQGNSIIRHAGGTLGKALQLTYPDLSFDLSRFGTRHFWHAKGNVKRFFEDYAKEYEFDPEDAEAWYRQRKQDIYEFRGGATILSVYNGSFIKALKDVFPHINIEEENFARLKREYWTDKNNRKDFFDNFAKNRGFDPLVADYWLAITSEMVLANKKGASVMRYYSNSLADALIDLYPNLELTSLAFAQMHKKYWKQECNRKLFFDTFAQQKNFDPLNPENWYSIKKQDILKQKGSTYMLQFYKGNFISALMDVYPNIGLRSNEFLKIERKWNTIVKRREFFDSIAAALNFDPLVAENWYPLPIQSDHINAVIYYHNNSVIEALIDLYPDVSFDESQFAVKRRGFWNVEANRRNFLLNFAKSNSFDPLDVNNWYQVKSGHVIAEKGGKTLLKFYSSSLAKTLESIFPELPWDWPSK